MPLEGVLEKKQPRDYAAKWQKRYFKLDGNNLKYFASQKDAAKAANVKGQIAIRDISEVHEQVYDGKANSMHRGFCVKTPQRTFDLLARSAEDCTRWIGGLNDARHEYIAGVLDDDGEADHRNVTGRERRGRATSGLGSIRRGAPHRSSTYSLGEVDDTDEAEPEDQRPPTAQSELTDLPEADGDDEPPGEAHGVAASAAPAAHAADDSDGGPTATTTTTATADHDGHGSSDEDRDFGRVHNTAVTLADSMENAGGAETPLPALNITIDPDDAASPEPVFADFGGSGRTEELSPSTAEQESERSTEGDTEEDPVTAEGLQDGEAAQTDGGLAAAETAAAAASADDQADRLAAYDGDKDAALPPLPPTASGSNPATHDAPVAGEPTAAPEDPKSRHFRPRSQLLEDAGGTADWKDGIGTPQNIFKVKMWGPKGEKISFAVTLEDQFTIDAVREGIVKVAPGLPREVIDSFDFFEISGAGVVRQLGGDDDPRTTRHQKRGDIVVMPPEERPITIFFQNASGVSSRDFVILPIKWKTTAKMICNPAHKAHSKGFRDKLKAIISDEDEAGPGLFLRKNFTDTMFAEDDRPLDVFYHTVEGGEREEIPHSTATKLIIKSKQLHPDSVRRGSSTSVAPDESGPLQGYLTKKGDDARAAWKRRWFIFKNGVLYYYKDQKDRDATNFINASAFVQCRRADRPERAFHFILDTNLARGDFHLAAESNSACERWVQGLQEAIVEPRFSGVLQKKGEQGGGWKSRYFELRDRHLVYFESQGDSRQKGTIVLDEQSYIEPSIDEETRFAVVTTSSKRKTGVYELRASSNAEAQEWIDEIRRATKGEAPLQRDDASDDEPEQAHFDDGEAAADDFDARGPNGSTDFRRGRYDDGRGGLDYRKGSIKFSRQFDRPTAKPVPLPAPYFDPTEANELSTFQQYNLDDSKENPYKDVPDDVWTGQAAPVELDPELERVMDQPLPGMLRGGAGFRTPPPIVDLSTEPYDPNRVKQLDTSPEGAKNGSTVKAALPPSLVEALEASAIADGPIAGAPEPNLPHDGGFVDILSPAMLKTIVLDEAGADLGADGHSRISLSSVRLARQPNGRWTIAGGAPPHGELPEEVLKTKPVVSFKLPGGIAAHFIADEERWHVAGKPPAATAAPPGPAVGPVDPVVKEWLRLGGARPIGHAEKAVESVLQLFNEPLLVVQNGMKGARQPATAVTAEMQAAVAKTRQLVLDDSRNERIGVLVRKEICGALADILRSGLRQSRLFGKTTLWTLVVAGSPKPSAASVSATYQLTAYKVVKDLERNPNMVGDPDIKFRSFVCAGLNHHFLCDWLDGVYHNEALIKKYFDKFAFMHICPEPIFNGLITVLEPLMSLPFRLFTSFELRRRTMTMRSGRARTSTAENARRQAAAAHGQKGRAVRSASVYVEQEDARPRSASGHIALPAAPEPSTEPAPSVDPVAAASEGEAGGPMAQALYDNASPDEGELLFKQGDILEILEQLDENWLLCAVDGQQGQVPINYVNILT